MLERKLEMVAAQDAKERAKEAALIPPGNACTHASHALFE